jgi:DNA-binding NarL/FixJ family response regulator
MGQLERNSHEAPRPAGLVWLRCSESVTTAGIAHALDGQMGVHVGLKRPEQQLSCVILCADAVENIAIEVKEMREEHPGTPVLIFGLHADLDLARTAFRSGSQGFIHAGMSPNQVARAIAVAATGEHVAPRQLLLQQLAVRGEPVVLDKLSARQREVLELVAESLSNAEIARRLYLSESTIKQHLRSSYKVLGVKNRREATRLVRSSR